MLRDINKLTTRFHRGRESKGGWYGLGAHMGACRGVGVQETKIAWSWERGPRKQLPRGNREARQSSSSGIPSSCRWKAIYPHWKPKSLEAPKPWNWGHSKIKGRASPRRM